MGFRPPPTAIGLQWAEGHRLHGLEVYARGLRLGKMLDLAEMYVNSGFTKRNDDDDMTAEDIEMMKSIFRLLVGNDDVVGPDVPFKPGLIESWNREADDGSPLPVSMVGVRELEMWEFQGIMDAYLEAGGVKLDDPLSQDSKSGEQSPELSALTELESLSQ